MTATLSTRQLRLVVLLVLVVVLGGGYYVVTMGKSTTQPASTTARTTPAATTPAATTPAKTTAAPTKTHHVATPVKLATHGLPVAVAQALRKHRVVVVSLTSPHSDVDSLASAEAQAAARSMNAGFVNLDVFHQNPGTAILRKLGVVDTPDVLVVKRPYLIYSEFKGFVDRDVVAQAVTDAR